MRIKFIALGICALLVLPIVLFGERSIVLKQENVPLNIDKYEASYYDQNVDHEVSYKNISQQKIVALRLGFISFTVFNDFLDSTKGISVETIEIGQIKKGTWTHAKYRGFSFRKYGTGIAFVDAVRFEDGTIWKADYDEILPQIKEIYADFSADILKKEEEK